METGGCVYHSWVNLFIYFNPLNYEGNFCGQVNQYVVRYVHSCLQLIFLIPISTNNPNSGKSMVLESSAKPSLGPNQFDSPGWLWQKIQEPLIQGANLLGLNVSSYLLTYRI